MKKLSHLVLSVMAINIFFACQNNTNVKSHEKERELFMKSMHLTEQYIDSLEHAPDSSSINLIRENFNNKITNINYQFPPDTDLNLSEEENDSLIRMFKRMDATIIKKLESFSGKNQKDSTSTSQDNSIVRNDSLKIISE